MSRIKRSRHDSGSLDSQSDLLPFEEHFAPGELGLSVAIAENPEVANLHEPIGQDVQKEPADKLKCIETHPLDLIVVGGIPIGKGNPLSIKPDDSLVGKGNPMRIAAKILHSLLGILEGRLTGNAHSLR